MRDAGRSTPAVPLPSESNSSVNGTSSAIGRGIVGFLMSPTLIGGRMSPVNGDATNATAPINGTVSSDNYPNGLFFGSNPFSNLTRYQSINNVIIDTLEGQLLTALIVVSFILIFLIREWVVQQQPALIGGAVIPPMDLEGEENQQPVAEADDLPLEPIPAGQDVADEDQLEHAFGPHRGDEEEEEEGEPVRATRPIARVRRRRAFPPNDPAPAEPDFFGSQPSQGYALSGRAPDYSHETSPLSSSSHPTRPQVNREMMARAAEVRRAMEEGSRSNADVAIPNTSSVYNFGQSTEGAFQFGASSSGNTYTPESSSSSGSRTPARGRAGDFLGDVPSLGYPGNNEDIDMIDMGNLDWRSRGSDSSGAQAGSPDSGSRVLNFDEGSYGEDVGTVPITGTIGVSFSTHGTGDQISSRGSIDEEHYDWRVQRVAGSSLSENAKGKLPQMVVPENWEDEGEDEGVKVGKEKNVYTSEDMEELKYDLVDSDSPPSYENYSGYLDGDDMDMEEDAEIEQPLLRGFQTSGLTVSTAEVENSDSSTQPSTPTTSGSQVAPLAADPVPAELPEAMMQEVMRQIGDRRDLDDLLRQLEVRREQQGARDLAAVVAAQPAARGRGAGLWNWLMGDQGAAPALPLLNPANAWDDLDTDDEGDADDFPVAGENAIPPDVQQAIADEDAADDFDGIMELIGMRGPIAGLVQNAAISSVLITATVALGVAFPYVTGKIVMIILVSWLAYLNHNGY